MRSIPGVTGVKRNGNQNKMLPFSGIARCRRWSRRKPMKMLTLFEEDASTDEIARNI